MNIMHNKVEKFITQLHHATHIERRNTAKYRSMIVSANQPAKLDKFQSQCYTKCSK